MRLSTLLEGSRVRWVGPIGADPEIVGTAADSRRVEPGDLFVAIRGRQSDGAAFVSEAIRRGARAVVAGSPRPRSVAAQVGWVQVEQPREAAGLLSRECYGRPDEALTLVGITGTNGKTTVTHLVESIGLAADRRCGRIGTIGYAFTGIERPLALTTPEAPDFYRLLAEMRDHDVDLVAMEVSSHALAQSRVAGARFAVAAFLNLSLDHLDFHGSERAYLDAKALLFESLGPDQVAVLPADSAEGRELAGRTRARVLTFGRSRAAQVRLSDEHCGLDGSSAILETPSGKLPIRTFLPGEFNLDNVAAAAACALALDLAPESISSGVLALDGVGGRMEKIDCGQPFTVIVDYAHTPEALERLLSWVRRVGEGRLLVVFGCGGARDGSKRAPMGRVAAEIADRIVLTSDNPRDEDPQQILEQVMEGAASVSGAGDRCLRIADRREAIRAAINEAGAGDVVVIAGKGHETTQVGGGRSRPFDDRLVAREALARGFGGVRGAAG